MNTACWPLESLIDDPFQTDVAWRRSQALGMSKEAFHGHLSALLRGEHAAAVALGVDRPQSHDLAPPVVTSDLATAQDCAQLATDFTPHLGADGVERVLSSTWLDLDVRRPSDRKAVMVALACSLFFNEDEDRHQRAPFEQWCRRKPIPSLHERTRFRAIHREPHRLCVIESRGPTWQVRDLLDHDIYTIDPSRLAPLLCDDGPVLFARLAHTTTGRVASLGWILPKQPDIEALHRWRQVRVWLHRTQERRATVETVMRDWPWLQEVIRSATTP